MSLIDPAEGLSCHEAELLISRRVDGELHDADLDRLETHLSGCDACHQTLSDWQDHSRQLDAGLDSLWNKSEPFRDREKPASPHATRIRKLAKPASKAANKTSRIKRCMWVPISMIASQFAAFLLLGVYCLLWPQSAEAPYGVSRPDPEPLPARNFIPIPEVDEVRRNLQRTPLLPISGPIIAAPRRMLLLPHEIRETSFWPSTQPWVTEHSEPVVMASFHREPLELVKADNVWSAYQFEAAGVVQNGKLALLTDAKTAKAFVQIVTPDGAVQAVASEDVQTLEPALRSVVTRFLERATKAEALRRAAR